MNLFNYLMNKNDKNLVDNDHMLEYLLNKSGNEKEVSGTEINITDVTRKKIIKLTLDKESTQNGTPTPSNPVEVKTVKGYKNLFDKTLTGIIVSNRLKTEILPTGIRVICNIRETASQANNAVRYVIIDVTNYISKKITLFCHAKSSSTNKGFFYLRLCKQNGDTSSSYGTLNSVETLDGDLSVTYEIPSGIGDYHYLMVAIYGNRNSPCEINDYVDYTNLMLVEGENNFPYVSYGTNYIYTTISDGTNSKNTTIPLNDNEIAGIGNYKDELIVDKNGHCWLNKKIGYQLIDYSYSGDTTSRTNTLRRTYSDILTGKEGLSNSNQFCNCFTYSSAIWANDRVGFNVSGKRITFSISRDITDTSSALNTWLSNNNLKIYYQLVTPQLIDLNYDVDIILYKGTNNITNSDNMNMTLIYK